MALGMYAECFNREDAGSSTRDDTLQGRHYGTAGNEMAGKWGNGHTRICSGSQKGTGQFGTVFVVARGMEGSVLECVS
jgi:hypothetical protein